MPYKVFISYSTRDLDIVRKVQELLNLPGIRTFVAEDDVKFGEELDEKILMHIRECNDFILLWSGNSKRSDYVKMEVGAARAMNKRIIPFIMKKRLKLPAFINGLKNIQEYKEPSLSLQKLQKNIVENAEKKKSENNNFWLGLGAVVFLLFALSKE